MDVFCAFLAANQNVGTRTVVVMSVTATNRTMSDSNRWRRNVRHCPNLGAHTSTHCFTDKSQN